jgi:hypothetical protein
MIVTELLKFVYEIKFGIEIDHKHDHKFQYNIYELKIKIIMVVSKFEIYLKINKINLMLSKK